MREQKITKTALFRVLKQACYQDNEWSIKTEISRGTYYNQIQRYSHKGIPVFELRISGLSKPDVFLLMGDTND